MKLVPPLLEYLGNGSGNAIPLAFQKVLYCYPPVTQFLTRITNQFIVPRTVPNNFS